MARCFVVGNGISLKTTDLDLIMGQPSIACNRINLVYPETQWRPSVYVHPESIVPDAEFIMENVNLGTECWIGEHYACPPVGKLGLVDAEHKPNNVHLIKECHHHLQNFDSQDDLPDEWHLPQLCSFGGSVNMAIQIAVQKGYYDEIILLGCDLLYRDRKPSHMHPAYEHGKEQPAFYQTRNALYGHLQALNYIRRKKLNVKIYNATRGGLLEIWERVRLEDVC